MRSLWLRRWVVMGTAWLFALAVQPNTAQQVYQQRSIAEAEAEAEADANVNVSALKARVN